ncbi:hypothetical protein ACVOZ6_004680 [Escherichia coli]
MLLTLTFALAGLFCCALAVVLRQLRLIAELRQVAAEAEAKRAEAVEAIGGFGRDFGEMAEKLNTYYEQRCIFYAQLLGLLNRMPKYGAPGNREAMFKANRIRTGVLKMLRQQLPIDPDQPNEDPIYLQALDRAGKARDLAGHADAGPDA